MVFGSILGALVVILLLLVIFFAGQANGARKQIQTILKENIALAEAAKKLSEELAKRPPITFSDNQVIHLATAINNVRKQLFGAVDENTPTIH